MDAYAHCKQVHEQLLSHFIASVHACMYVIEVRIKVEFSAALDGNFYQWRTQFYKAFRGCFFSMSVHSRYNSFHTSYARLPLEF